MVALPLGVAVRFIHYALFEGSFLSVHYYLVDLLVVAAIACLSYRFYETRQMTTQYSWIYERAGPLSWRERPQA